MNKKQQTIDAYNAHAESIGWKFDQQGVRIHDINECFALIETPTPKVFEIGCGNGRDATEIYLRTKNYSGMDISEKLIELARTKLPNADFKIGDIETFEFPDNLDIIFAFASLLHVPKESLRQILARAYSSLNPGGVFRISLKHSPQYREVITDDEFGTRTFFYYSADDLEEMRGAFRITSLKIHELRGQKWLEAILRK